MSAWPIQDGNPKRYAPYVGLSWQWAETGMRDSRDRLGASVYTTRRGHPLSSNLPDTLHITEETYFNLYGDTSQIQVLNSSMENTALPGAAEHREPVPVMWTRLTGKGRVFASAAGHFSATHNDAYFRPLVTLNANVKFDVVTIRPASAAADAVWSLSKRSVDRMVPHAGQVYLISGRKLQGQIGLMP